MEDSIAAGSRWGQTNWALLLTFALGLLTQSANAEDVSPELIEPPVCSAATAGKLPALEGICSVTPLGDGHNEVKANLTAKTAPIEVGGYTGVGPGSRTR